MAFFDDEVPDLPPVKSDVPGRFLPLPASQQAPSSWFEKVRSILSDVHAFGRAVDTTTANIENKTVLSTGTTTRRSLAARFGDVVNVLDWGADPTGVLDSTAAIQAALDYALQNRKGTVWLPAGTYRITGPLHLGYGVGYSRVSFVGDGRRYNGEAIIGGTAIVAEHSDAPAIAIQGGRRVRVAHMAILGPNFAHVKDNQLGSGPLYALLDDTVRSNWFKAGLHANADSRYAPCAGVAIDPYGGVRPTPSYPDVAYPSWLGGSVPQYGKLLTNVTNFEDVEIGGFVVGVVTQPSGADGNGDYIGFQDCDIRRNVTALSVSHTQARAIQARNTRFDDNYLVLTNIQHGVQQGRIDAHFSGCSFDRIEHLLDIASHHASACLFSSCNGELIGRIGSVSVFASDNSPVVFDVCTLNFHGETEKVSPVDYIVVAGSQPVVFRGCSLRVPRIFAYQGEVSFDNTDVRLMADQADWGALLSDRLAVNAGRSIFPSLSGSGLQIPPRLMVKSRQYADVTLNTRTGWLADLHALHLSQRPGDFTRYGRNFGWPAWAPLQHPHGEFFGCGIGRTINRATTPLVSVSVSDIDFTVTLAAGTRSAGTLGEMLIGVGDLAMDATTGARFHVLSVAGDVVVLRLLNGYRKVGSARVTALTMALNTGSLIFRSSRVYALPYPTFGTTTSGSDVITDVGRGDSFFDYGTNIQVGDYLLSATSVHELTGGRKVFSIPAKVTAVDTAARTVTLDKLASRTASLLPLNFWLRAP